MKLTASDVHREMLKLANPEKAKLLQRFFKTGSGEYAEGDRFHGIMVPQTRKVATDYKEMPLSEVVNLLSSPFHEERLCALIVLVHQYRHGDEKTRTKIYDTYLANTLFINNWDLVDLSAHHIVGPQIKGDVRPLERLARSKLLWDRRIAVLATFWYIKEGNAQLALRIADMLLNDKHDLIHKAVGWMLREVGKRCSEQLLMEFLDDHVTEMPRTMLRYAIERLPQQKKMYYMKA